MFEFEFFFQFYCILFRALFWPLFYQFWPFVTLLHVSLPPNYLGSEYQAQVNLTKGHILYFQCGHRTCMIWNLFLTRLYISLGIVSASFDVFGHFLHFVTCHSPRIILGWEAKPKQS